LGAQHSFYPGKNLINQLSRSGLTTGLNPFFAGNNLYNAISGGFNGNAFANSAFQRLKRQTGNGNEEPEVDDEDDDVIDIQR
jgi:hypothetical protein